MLLITGGDAGGRAINDFAEANGRPCGWFERARRYGQPPRRWISKWFLATMRCDCGRPPRSPTERRCRRSAAPICEAPPRPAGRDGLCRNPEIRGFLVALSAYHDVGILAHWLLWGILPVSLWGGLLVLLAVLPLAVVRTPSRRVRAAVTILSVPLSMLAALTLSRGSYG
jgi:hypothetical protein